MPASLRCDQFYLLINR
ncbi:hypothetical protein YPPY34_2589, partial [Yersinia pestis PY-34]